jgi:hypothetical protein
LNVIGDQSAKNPPMRNTSQRQRVVVDVTANGECGVQKLAVLGAGFWVLGSVLGSGFKEQVLGSKAGSAFKSRFCVHLREP